VLVLTSFITLANLPNRYSALCWRPVTHAPTWTSYSALYRFGRLSITFIQIVSYRELYTVFQKSDPKIQITVTTARLIRINYPLSGFNYHLSDVNVANFNKIHRIVSEQQLF